MRALVVEDERVLSNAIAAALRNEFDVEVDIASDGQSALQLAAENVYALTVIDFWIPPPTGIELLQLWRGNERTGPIVMMSGTYDGPERNKALAAGASLFFEKPFSLFDLMDGVHTLLRHPDATRTDR